MTQDNKGNNDGENEDDDGDDKGVGDNEDKESAKEGGNQGIPRPYNNNLVQPEPKHPTLYKLIQQLPKNFQSIIFQKQ